MQRWARKEIDSVAKKKQFIPPCAIMPVHAPITVFDERWPFRKIFSWKERKKKKKKYESCNSPLWSSFPWSYFFHGDWLFSRAAVSPSPWWFCTRARTRTRYGRTRSASCPAPCAAGCPARGWICGIDLWSACALSPARLSSPRSRPGSLTFCFDKERQRNWRLMYSFLIWMEFSEDAFVCFDDIEDAFDSMMKYGIIINCLYREELVIQNNPIYFFHDL